MLTQETLGEFLTAIVTLLGMAHLLGFVFSKINLPRVVGEIAGGFVLGPSVLGTFWPGLSAFLVSTDQVVTTLVDAIYWLGLTLLMFTAGFRVQLRRGAEDSSVVMVLLASATVIPFATGMTLTLAFDFSHLSGANGSPLALTIIVAIAMAVTSIPVISKIFLDLGIIETRFARIVVTASTIQDVLLWGALAVVTGTRGVEAATSVDGAISLEFAFSVLTPLVFCIAGIWLAPKVLTYVQRSPAVQVISFAPLGYVLLWCFLFCILASALNVSIVFGALVAGVAFGSLRKGRLNEIKEQIESFSLAFFVPLYFAVVGYRIDLPQYFDPLLTLGFFAVSTAVVLVSVYPAMRMLRFDTVSSANFAIAMNTRGGPGIVLASITYSFGLIGGELFVALTLTAISTSLLTGVWFNQLTKHGIPLARPSHEEHKA